MDCARILDDALESFSPHLIGPIGWLIRAWDYAACLRPPFRRFSKLDRDTRMRILTDTYKSRYLMKRAPVEMLKHLCGFAFGASERVAAEMGFDGRCLDTHPAKSGPRLQPLRFPEVQGEIHEKVDVCIIGSGAGGAVVAAELAARGMSVLVLEEGDYFTAEEDFQGPPLRRVTRTYRDQGTITALGVPPIPVPLGRAVGGTTVINSGTCFRAPDKVLNEWVSRFGLEGYDPQSLAPIFERIETILNVMPVPWEIIGRNAEIFDRGVRALGLKGEPLRRNIKDCRGCGVCAFGCPSDAKQAMHLSYLPRAASNGARIYARCRAEVLQKRGQRVVGVDASILDRCTETVKGRLRVTAEAVVVSCGAIHTPGFLRLNKVGLGSGELGRNLRLHPALSVSASFDEDIYAWRGTLQSYGVDHLVASDDVMLEVTSLLPSMAINAGKVVGRETKSMLADFKRRAACGLFVSDSSSGRVLQLSRRTTPVVLYRLNRQDTERLLRGMALVAEIFFAAGAHTVHTGHSEIPILKNSKDLSELRDVGRWGSSGLFPTAFHPMGTCRMGPDPKHSVVGLDGQVHGTERLYVADGSLFPTCVGVNPQETIMAFATKIAERIVLGPSS